MTGYGQGVESNTRITDQPARVPKTGPCATGKISSIRHFQILVKIPFSQLSIYYLGLLRKIASLEHLSFSALDYRCTLLIFCHLVPVIFERINCLPRVPD